MDLFIVLKIHFSYEFCKYDCVFYMNNVEITLFGLYISLFVFPRFKKNPYKITCRPIGNWRDGRRHRNQG